MTTENLKKCPFCGYDKVSIIINEYAPIPHMGYKGGKTEDVSCPVCLCQAPKHVWNARAYSGPSVEEIKKIIDDNTGATVDNYYLDMASIAIHAKFSTEEKV